MLKKILHLALRDPSHRVGFCYVADGRDDPINAAQPGQVIRIEGKGPPWIVVNDAPTTAIVARWPGQLWKVAILEPPQAQDQPSAHARYTRALSVKVLSEENLSTLFGERGESVVGILNEASTLSYEMAKSLSSARNPDAPAAYDRTFRRWAEAENLPIEYDGTLDGTLKMGAMPPGSPIHVSVAGRLRTMQLVLPASQAVGPSSRA